jgi:hypothetical protein
MSKAVREALLRGEHRERGGPRPSGRGEGGNGEGVGAPRSLDGGLAGSAADPTGGNPEGGSPVPACRASVPHRPRLRSRRPGAACGTSQRSVLWTLSVRLCSECHAVWPTRPVGAAYFGGSGRHDADDYCASCGAAAPWRDRTETAPVVAVEQPTKGPQTPKGRRAPGVVRAARITLVGGVLVALIGGAFAMLKREGEKVSIGNQSVRSLSIGMGQSVVEFSE